MDSSWRWEIQFSVTISFESTKTFKITLDFLSLLWYCVVLTGGATNGKHNKRTVARQYHTRGGQSDELKGDERAPWVHGEASRGLGEKLY